MTERLTAKKHLSRPAPGRASAAIARDLLRLVRQHGGDPARILREAELAPLGPSLLGTEVSREPLNHAQFARLYAHCTWALDAAAARQEGREPLTKLGIDMLCHCVITARTMRDAIARADQFALLLGPRLARFDLAVEDGVARLRMATQRQHRNACAYLSDLTGLATYHRLFGWLIGEAIPLLRVEMRYAPLLSATTTAWLMPHSIHHDAPENALHFPAACLDRPLVRSPAELEAFIAAFPFDLEQPQSKHMPLSERIARLLVTALASGEPLLTAARLGQQLSISIATLKRRLATEGTSLSHLKEEARREAATRLLADHRLSITEIAQRLFFSDAGAFRRAFQRWHGRSPTRWRIAMQEGQYRSASAP